MTYINKLQNFKTITGDPLDQKTKRKFLERPSSVTVPDPDLYLKDMDESIRWVGQIISVEDARTTEEHDAGLSPYTGTFQFFGGIDNSNIIDFDSKDRFSGYERVYYVSTDGNDNTAIYGKYDSPYKLINTASSAAKASGRKSIVYVTKGIYKEQSITRNGVDMFFEEGAIVWTDIDGASVINDLDSNLGCTFNIMGQGEFYNQTWNPGNDSEGFNIRYASNINFEAKKVDSVQIWGNSSVNINFQNLEILLQIGVQRNKNISFKNTFFNTPIHFANYNGFNSKIDFDLCTIDLLSDDIQSLLDIKDPEGNIIFTIQPNNQNLTDYIVDTSEMTREEVVNYQNQDAGRKTFLAAINYEESLSGNSGDAHDNYKVSFRNSVIRIKKEKCIGVRVINNYNNPGSSFYVQNLTIIDETEGKDTTAIVSGRKDTVTTPLEYGIGSVFTNCKVKEETITGYLPLEKTFELIGTDIDDLNVSTDTTYSSSKIEEIKGSIPQLPDMILEGLETSISGSTVTVNPGRWLISQNNYETTEDTTLLLSPADPEYDRIDVIIANDEGNILVVEGVAAENYIKPTIPSGSIEIAFAIVGSEILFQSDTNFISITYNELRTLKQNNQLTEGAYYRITDNRTKHIILDTNVVNTGPIEPLVILASSKNTFNSEAFSTVHLFDKIEYNFDDNLCEDGVTERTGKIISRIDTIKKIGSLNEDYRNIKYRLYDITGIEHETAVQTSSSLFSLTTVRGVVPSEPDWNYEYFIDFGSVSHDAKPQLSINKGSNTITAEIVKYGNVSLAENELQTLLTNGKAYVYFSLPINKYVIKSSASIENLVKGVYSYKNADFTIGNNTRLTVDPDNYEDVYAFQYSDGGDARDIILPKSTDDNYSRVILRTVNNLTKNAKFDGLAKNVVFKSPDFDGFKAIGTFRDSLIFSNAGGINTSSHFDNNLICGGGGRLAMAFTPLAVVFNTSVFKLGANVYATFFSTCTNSTIYFEGGAGSSILNNSFGLTANSVLNINTTTGTFKDNSAIVLRNKWVENSVRWNNVNLNLDSSKEVFTESKTNTSIFRNIEADNITSEITEELTVNLGPGETLGGYKTSDIISKGTNIELVIKKLLTKAQPVSYLAPTTTLAKTPTTNYYELGSSVSITLTPTFNARDSGGIDTHVLKKNGTDVHTDFSAYLDSFVANTLGSITYSSTIAYLQGACKLNNLGEQDCTGRIEAGSLTKSQTTNIILPWFYGVSDTDDVSDIYATGTKVVSNVTAELTVNSFGSGIKFMWFAVPKGSKTFTSWYRTELNQGGIGNPGDLFKAKVTKLVSSSGLAQDYEDEEYDFYITSSATDSSVTTKLN